MDRDRGFYYQRIILSAAVGQTWGEVWVDYYSKFSHVGSFCFEGDFAAHLNSREQWYPTGASFPRG